MGCREASSWLSAISAATTTAAAVSSLKHEHFYRPSVFFCCINGPNDSTSSSSLSSAGVLRRRWYNPLRRRRSDQTPSSEIARHWIEADPVAVAPSQERYKFVSYNILGDRNASKHRDLYPNVPSMYMKWHHRKRAICEELIALNPDIICLQEVDKYFDLLTIMEKAGYTGSYKRRTGDAIDGCAMFWKADKFRLLVGESIEFKRYDICDNVAQLSVFEMCKAESKRVLIGNIHVLYNPNRGDVKLGQIRFLMERAHILSEKWGNVPIVLAGDYNATPESAIYEFLSSSELNIMLHDRRELSGQRSCNPAQVLYAKKEMGNPLVFMERFVKSFWTDEEVKAATGNAESRLAVHPLKLKSSYATVKGSTSTRGSNGEPLATSYHSKFIGTVDYLWYSDGIVPTGVLDTPPIDILRRTGGLPCQKLGSDHLALVAEFAFTRGSEEDNKMTTPVTI